MPDEPDNKNGNESNLAAMGPYSNLDINVEELLEESVEELLEESAAEPGAGAQDDFGSELEEMDLSDSLDDLPNASDLDSAADSDLLDGDETIDTSVLLDEDDDEDPLDLDIEKLMDPAPTQKADDDSPGWEEQLDSTDQNPGEEAETMRAPPDRQTEPPPMLYEVDTEPQSAQFKIPEQAQESSSGVPKVVMILAGLVILMILGMGATLGLALHNAETERQRMAEEITSLRQLAATATKTDTGALEERVDHLSEQLSLLSHQLNELRDSSATSSGAQIELIEQRLQKLESSTVRSRSPTAIRAPKTTSIEKKSTPVVAKRTGWVVNLMSFVKRVNASATAKKLSAKGYSAGYHPAEVNGRQWYRVFISGYASRAKAVSAQEKLARELKISNSWVEYRDSSSK